MVEINPEYTTYHFVADQFNTHKSESLVRFVADFCDIDFKWTYQGKVLKA